MENHVDCVVYSSSVVVENGFPEVSLPFTKMHHTKRTSIRVIVKLSTT